MSLRVVIGSDIRLYRDGLDAHLSQVGGFTIVGTVVRRVEALECVTASHPDIVLLDLAMQESLEIVADIHAYAPEVHVVVIAVPETERSVIACAEAGVAAYVPRAASLDDLVATLQSVVRGESIVSPRMAASLLARVRTLAADRVRPLDVTTLTSREQEILGLLEHGLSNKQIAARLRIEMPTVKNHVHNILAKLNVSRRSEAVARLRGATPASAPSFLAPYRPGARAAD
jgi:DNA-binding NarL/FixJ family response regulator